MDKNAIKKYAIWARKELIARVTQKAEQYEITEKKITSAEADSISGRLLSGVEKKQRAALIGKIKTDGFEQVMEEVAYTWFNRFTALRFMEVNNYLPSHTRVFSNEIGEFKPLILHDAIQLNIDGLNMDKVFALKEANKTEELYKYLLITQCNDLSKILPGMFQKIADYTELLIPDYLLREGSVLEQMIKMIPEDNWNDQVQIIGWLYEAYNTELNELVYDGTLSKAKIPKELVPAATTIFTPDWPVHYMVENSLGRLWMEGHTASGGKYLPIRNTDGSVNIEKGRWNYYIEEAEQEEKVQKQLEKTNKSISNLKPEELLVIDPCAGSGHILCVLFDVLVDIYEDYGYTAKDAVVSIVKNNLWGLDINDRAAQLAYFAVMMKARQYDRRFFNRCVQPNIYAIKESNAINRDHLEYLGKSLNENDRRRAHKELLNLLDEFTDAKEYGSILQIGTYDWDLLSQYVVEDRTNKQITLGEMGIDYTCEQLNLLIMQGKALTQKYHVVVTNPPYLGSNRFGGKLDKYVKSKYPAAKSDLSMVMYQHSIDDLVMPNGFVSFITTTSWMFLSSFEKLRLHASENVTLSSLVDYATELFDGKVGHNPIVSWTVKKAVITDYNLTAIRLVDYCFSRRDEKESQYLSGKNRYIARQDNFAKIPGSPIAYWVSESFFRAFDQPKLGESVELVEGIHTRNNDEYLRLWHEIDITKSSLLSFSHDKKWFAYNKGGLFRQWYGNNEYVVNWEDDGKAIKAFPKASIGACTHFFKEGITFTFLTSGINTFRYSPEGFLYDMAGPNIYPDDDNRLFYYLALFVSKLSPYFLNVINPTLNMPLGDVKKFPIIFEETKLGEITSKAKKCVELAHADWDSYETSWEFERHPLIPFDYGQSVLIADCWKNWKLQCDERYAQLKITEEEINKIFIDIYNLQDELTPEIQDKDVTVRKADLQREIRSLISYAVGCMFGRYSLDKTGLTFAGGLWDISKYELYMPDKDAIIPICDDEYFEDDIVGRFVRFIEIVFGKDTLEENLQFVAMALGGKGTSRQAIRNYFLNEFYLDHLRVYQKKPIYWLFDSGKKNGFKCLVYIHRYQPDTIARIRTDYVHEQQSRYRTAITDLEQRISGSGVSDRVKLNKRLLLLRDQADEIREYEEKIHHLADRMISINLDDGIKHNYEIFKDILAEIK